MARIICVANQKGGVGKTTTSVNLAAALTELGKRVLIVDMDPQGNASSGLGVKRYENQENNVYQVLIGEKAIHEAIQTTHVTNLDVIPANPDLVGAEIELVDMPQREYRLKAALAEVADKYQYILIDCPPSLGLLTVNSLSAADTFLVPLQCEYYALEGLSQLLNTAGLIKKSLNPELRIEGIVLTMFDARNNLSHQVVAEIQSHFADKVFQAIIPRNVRLSEAPSHGQTIFQYDPKSLGAKKYKELAVELDFRVYGSAVVAEEPAEEVVVPEVSHPAPEQNAGATNFVEQNFAEEVAVEEVVVEENVLEQTVIAQDVANQNAVEQNFAQSEVSHLDFIETITAETPVAIEEEEPTEENTRPDHLYLAGERVPYPNENHLDEVEIEIEDVRPNLQVVKNEPSPDGDAHV